MDGDRHHSRVLPGAGDTADTMSCLLYIYSVDSTHIYTRSEVIFKKSSNLYCRLNLDRVLMVGTKVSKGFFV